MRKYQELKKKYKKLKKEYMKYVGDPEGIYFLFKRHAVNFL